MVPQEPEGGAAAPGTAVKKLARAVELHQQGQLEPADALYREVLQAEPENPDALHFLGLLETHRGNPQAALGLISRAVAIVPDNPAAWCNRGNALIELRRPEEALRDFDRALALAPQAAEVHQQRGNALMALRRHTEALASYDRALALQPDSAETLSDRGVALYRLGRFAEALASYDRALVLNPDRADAHNNRGNALAELRRHMEALESYDRALKLRPDSAEALSNRGATLFCLGRFAEALLSYDQALALNPDYAEAHNNRGNTLYRLRRYAEALKHYDRALALRPDYAEAHNNRGNALQALGRHGEALESYDQAIRCKPDYAEAYCSKGFLKLLLGEFEEGWPLYEWRWKTPDLLQRARHLPGAAWTGRQDLRGRTVLLYAEQGLGDAIQFSRYVARVEALGAAVILEVEPALQTLLATLSPTAQVVAQGAALPPFDYHCPIMSLPLAFGTTLATVPANVPYLHADPAKASRWREKLGRKTRLRAGLAWSGTQRHRNDHNRSVPLEALGPLAAAGWELHCVQKEIRPEDEPRLAQYAIRVHAPELHDLADTAALLGALDLVITVDTSVAHLAGALGLPVWILLPHTPDFRWLTDRADSPWYPTARLFRQPAPGDWAGVTAAVVTEMRKVPHRPGH